MSKEVSKDPNPLAAERREYQRSVLRRSSIDPDPFRQLAAWLEAAREAHLGEPTAMTLATAKPDGVPSARTVLLKGLDPRGLTFFTNERSQKGREIAANPHAALCFYWYGLERQVRVVGAVERVSREESAAYFVSRPRASRIGAWSSPQSEVIADRAALEALLTATEARFPDEDIPLPPFWGGFRVVPRLFEFWQGRPGRVHDRFRYSRGAEPDADEPPAWRIERLAP